MDPMATVSRSRVACLAAADLHRRVRATCEASMRLCKRAVGMRRRVRLASSGGSDHRDIPISESAIRAQLRGLLRRGILPPGAPTVVARHSEERRGCTGGGVQFQRGDLGYEIINDQTVSLVLHQRCIELWTELVLDRSVHRFRVDRTGLLSRPAFGRASSALSTPVYFQPSCHVECSLANALRPIPA